MDKQDEIIQMLQEIQSDMGQIAAGRLKKPEPALDIPPMGGDEAGLKAAMEADEAKEGPSEDSSETPEYQAKEEELGIEKHEPEEEEVLPRWKQRMKKGQ